MKKIKRILVANRAEIACRIIATCRELNIETVAIYATGEQKSKHVLMADDSFCLGEGELSETYLNKKKIIMAAKEYRVDAIHPGYGFLSENSEFSAMVEKSDIIFIGPSATHIDLMGDKITSKQKAVELGVPTIPGYHGKKQDLETLRKQARVIGFPVLIKATAGGGGKGMRIVNREENFSTELESAKREALSSFGNDDVLLERFVTGPRHIEVQVISDEHGGHYHLFERECSIQRRYQKIIEETPSPALDDKQRKEILESALKITAGIDYRGAGTVEFILDRDGSYYFLEMNTRLQVEHPITEMITSLDLVALQIEVAENKKLSESIKRIVPKGHSIEVRIYAEDPMNNFYPTTGQVFSVGEHFFPGVRLDTAVKSGDQITVNYDPMIAKLIAYAPTRQQAIKKMLYALRDYSFLGLQTNRNLLKRILLDESFAKGNYDTNFINDHPELIKRDNNELYMALAIASDHLLPSCTNQEVHGNVAVDSELSVNKELYNFRNTQL